MSARLLPRCPPAWGHPVLLSTRPRPICVGAGGGEDRSFLLNPAIAQREALRKFYLSSTSEEQLAVLESTPAEVLDVETSLHLLGHMAQLALKGELPGDEAEKGTLLLGVYANLEATLPSLTPLQVGALLWSLACVGQPQQWTDALLHDVAERELAAGRVPGYNTREVASILDALGRLARPPCSTAVQRYGVQLAGELLRRMEGAPYVRGSFAAADLADLAAACGQLCGGGGSELSLPGTAPPGAALPVEVASLMDAVAVEVRRQLANKHSLRSPLLPRDVLRLLGGYAALRHRSDAVSGMLDAVAGVVVARIKARHLNAVSRPADLAAVLRAFADLGHSSVSVPELLTAVGEQVRLQAAAEQQQPEASGPAAGFGGRGSEPGLTLRDLNALLAAHLELGFAPSQVMLQALQPCIARRLEGSPAAEVGALLGLLAHAEYRPCEALLRLMRARVEDGSEGSEALVAAALADVERMRVS